MGFKENDRRQLEQELQGESNQKLLRDLQGKSPFLRRFHTWAYVITFMRSGTSDDPRKDEVLRPILLAHKEDKDHRWRTILLVIFWPGLKSIHWDKKNWDPDLEERWQNIVWTFLKIVCRIDVSRRPDRLVQKVINDTIHHLHDEYRRIWKIKSREIMTESDKDDSLIGEKEFSSQEIKEVVWIKKLRTYMQEGLINEADFLLLIGTRVYGESLVDYVRERGLDYQAISKRRRRAEAAIRKYEKNFHEHVQKNEAPPPLYVIGKTNRKG